jgi:hypothetical protein
MWSFSQLGSGVQDLYSTFTPGLSPPQTPCNPLKLCHRYGRMQRVGACFTVNVGTSCRMDMRLTRVSIVARLLDSHAASLRYQPNMLPEIAILNRDRTLTRACT